MRFYVFFTLAALLAVAPDLVAARPTSQGLRGASTLAWAQKGTSENRDLEELERIRLERLRTAGQANQANPLTHGFDLWSTLRSAFSPAANPAGPPTVPESSKDSFFKLPIMQRALQVLAYPRFAKAVVDVQASPNRMNFVYAECAWFVLIFLLRIWRANVLTHWARRLWMRIWTGVLLLVGAVLVIPGLTIGMVYYRALGLLATIFGFNNPFPG